MCHYKQLGKIKVIKPVVSGALKLDLLHSKGALQEKVILIMEMGRKVRVKGA